MRDRPVLVIGVGNEYRGDDAVGLVVARRLRGRLPAGVAVLEAEGEGTALIPAWRGAETVILVDAVRSSSPPGSLHRLEAHRRALPAYLFRHSTHALNLAEAIELARALGELPPRVIVLGIEGESFQTGRGLSPAVARAAVRAARAVLAEVEAAKAIATGGRGRA